MTFTGARLELNYATSGAGAILVAVLDESGRELPGFEAAQCREIFGDELARTVAWEGDSNLGNLAGKPVRLRFDLVEADLFSFRFTAEEGE